MVTYDSAAVLQNMRSILLVHLSTTFDHTKIRRFRTISTLWQEPRTTFDSPETIMVAQKVRMRSSERSIHI